MQLLVLPVIIAGFGTGMRSTLIPVIAIVIKSTLSFFCASGGGIYYYDNGDKFEGNFLYLGFVFGKGIYYYNDISEYVGEYASLLPLR